jgi:Tol biopolymer transport system component
VALGPGFLRAEDADDKPPDRLIGYTEFHTDRPGGRYVNVWTMRAAVIKADGTDRRVLGEDLTREKGSWMQFYGWSPDGRTAILLRGWESEENGKWEEAHKTFRYSADGWLYDGYLFDLKSGQATNVTGVERVSHYNVGLGYWPGDATKLGFLALVGGVNRRFRMDLDGKNKRDLLKDSPNLVHGMSLSPDGKRGAYEDERYRLFLADSDGSNARQVQTGQRFNFLPSWSPDGAWVLFLAGEHYDCHPHIVKPDGTGLKKLASRNGYRGVIDYLDVYDFHDGSSDTPVWAHNGKSVFYTAKVGRKVELFRVTLDGKSEQLTDTPAGSMHYHPNPSPDCKWLLYGSKRDGVRQLYVMRLSDKKEWRITDLKKGHAAMWPHWQPAAKKP